MLTKAIAILTLLACSATAIAQAPKAPAVGYVFPPVISAGKQSQVHFGGYDFTSDMQWFLLDSHLPADQRIKLHTDGHPGDYHITPPPYWVGPRAMSTPLPIPREVAVTLDVNEQTPAGLIRWQLANANGSSAMAAFYVSRGSEIVESRSRDLPQRIAAIPIGISGRISKVAEVDRYEVVASKDGPISIDLMTRRLGTDLNGVVEVRDARGNLMADMADTEGRDGAVTFAATAGATYTISLHDADFRGDRAFVYRLAISPGPRIVCTSPAFGQRGTSREVEFIGMGVATGKAQLESIRQPVTFPADAAMIAHTHTLKTPHGDLDVTIPLSHLPQSTHGEIARPIEGAAEISPPFAVTAPLLKSAEQHRYKWMAKKGDAWSIQLQSWAIGGTLDVALVILGPDGKQVAESDDLPGTTDAALEFSAAADGVHTCIVRSIAAGPGRADEIYHLSIEPRTPDFSLALPQQIPLPLAGKVEVTITATRMAGFDGEITLEPIGLPDGVTAVAPLVIPAGKKDVKITLQSAADAAVTARMIQFRGSAKVGETSITREAFAAPAALLASRSPAESRTNQVLLAMTMAPPFEVLVLDRERQREVHRGTTYLADLDIARKEGFTGEVRIEMTAAQARYRHGMRGPIITVPGNATRGIYPISLPEWLPTDVTQRMNVHGVATVPDPKGTLRQLTKPADSRITMIMEGALLKLSSPAKELTIRAGETFEVPVHLSRSTKLPLPATVELVVPEELKGLLRGESIVIAPDNENGMLRITSIADAKLHGHWSLTLKATSMEDGKWPVVSQFELPIDFENR